MVGVVGEPAAAEGPAEAEKPAEGSDAEVGGPPTPTRGRESLAGDEAMPAAAAAAAAAAALKTRARPRAGPKRRRASQQTADEPNFGVASRTRKRGE